MRALVNKIIFNKIRSYFGLHARDKSITRANNFGLQTYCIVNSITILGKRRGNSCPIVQKLQLIRIKLSVSQIRK
jgi:hypothetical protein